MREYDRPARQALAELAPGNTLLRPRLQARDHRPGHRHRPTGRRASSGGSAPGCGYVRTAPAQEDTTPLPALRRAAASPTTDCLFQVLQPTRVTRRDKRDDARIRDDSDDRDRRFYATVVAVDIDPARHRAGRGGTRSDTFGVDFTRHAMIRHFNLGARATTGAADDRSPGEEVRLNPFHVCTSCGGTTADGPPAVSQRLAALARRLDRHAGRRAPPALVPVPARAAARRTPTSTCSSPTSCDTEALRILLPAVDRAGRGAARLLRRRAAAGHRRPVRRRPGHLPGRTRATMPDAEERRDAATSSSSTTPSRGGTGYLHRLARPEEFRGRPGAAREAIADCVCRHRGPRPAATAACCATPATRSSR